ncbi:MAG TPA: flagellar protein FlaG [Paenalcaligenes sp.]|nr:flagellar protein FlaG [Paenalcaligenes sp.]
MVKPIPIHHAIQTQQLPQEPHQKLETEQTQIETVVPEPTKTLESTLSQKKLLPNSIESALEQLNAQMHPWATGMQFEMDPELERLVVSIIDKETGAVLRSIPSETLLRVAKMITTFQGQHVNTHA